MKQDQILIKLTRIEDKLDAHLKDHKFKFDLFTRAIIPGTSILVAILTSAITHMFKQR